MFFQGGKALEFEVEEEAAVGTVGGYVSATDNDSGDNALIDYRITGESLLVWLISNFCRALMFIVLYSKPTTIVLEVTGH